MKAIETKYRGPTNCRGSRIIATDSDGNRATISYNHAKNSEGNHQAAAFELCERMGWRGVLQGGHTKDGMAWTWIDENYQAAIGVPPKVTIRGRRWFQKSAGNTYHSVSVSVDGEPVGQAEFVYGYGDHYIQTAHSLLQNAGIYPKGDDSAPNGIPASWEKFRADMMDYRDRFDVSVVDVDRKRDL
jgi:hypothetical protein